MNIVKKYTAIKLETKTLDRTVQVELEYGTIEGPYYSQEHPQQEFDTEEEALKWAYEKNKYATWLILPIVKFDTN